MSRPVSLIDWNNPPQLQNEEFVVETSYDALNRPLTLTQPDGKVISYSYDKGGLLKTVSADGVLHVSNITYNPKRQRENIYYDNNTKTKYEYNPLNFRLTRLLTTRNNGQDILQDLNYSYDPVGNIIQQRDDGQQTHYFNNSVIEPVCNYEYDALYRLTQATGRELSALQMPAHTDFANHIQCPNSDTSAMQNYNQRYQYDELGNIKQISSSSHNNNWTREYVYDQSLSENRPKDNYLLGHGGGTVYAYDTHGNMLKMLHLSTMLYDYQDQLVSASNGTFTSYYNYDAQGNRTCKTVVKGNVKEQRYYIGGYEVYRKHTNNVLDIERTTVNIADDEKVFVRIETKTNENPVVRYQYDNHLGSACLELDNNGSIISYEEYHPFGTTSYRSGRTETEVSLKRYKYCAKERDEETGLYYYGMRYYAAWLCRFINVDPLQFKYPYYTPYQYAGNKPISYIDLDGGEEKKPQTVRMIFWGGAKLKNDNSTFYFASRNVIKDYKNDMIIIDKKATTAKDITSQINKQKDNSIQSIDFFAHGSQYALYMVKDKNTGINSSTSENITNPESNNLYASKTVKIAQSWGGGKETDVINSINFKKFTINAKIEIHGCKSAAETFLVDNIAINLSEELFAVGKIKAVVIAHLEKANPNINGGKESNEEQDYRHGIRVIYHNGEELFRTSEKGRITAKEINRYLDKKNLKNDKK